MKSRIPKGNRYTGHYALVCNDGSLWMVFSNKEDALTYLSECAPGPGDPLRIYKAEIVLGREVKH